MSKVRKLIKEYYPYIVLGGLILVLLFWNAFYLENWLDSDMAAEMIFSKLLAQEGKLFATTNWYYSTEFRFLYTHLLMGPLFRFLDNWHVIRMITNAVFYILLLTSYFYMMKELPVSKKNRLLGGAVLLLPFSETMMLHVHIGNTYMSHIIILFFYIGLFLRLVKTGKKLSVGRFFLWVVYIVLSIVCGVSGVRYMLALQCPLFLAAVWYLWSSDAFERLRSTPGKETIKAVFCEERLRFLVVSALGVLGCVAGYGVNIIYVSRTYSFQTYESTSFIDVYQGIFMGRMQDAFGSLLMLFGYIPGKSVLSLRGVLSMMAFLMLFLLGYAALKVRKEKVPFKRFFVLLFYSSFLLNSFAFVFTNSTLVPRYYITTVILLIPIVIFYLEEEKKPLDRYIVVCLFTVCLLTMTAKTGLSMMTTDKNAEEKAVAKELVENGYTFGYATYWNANIVQELSNGAVEVANLHLNEDGTLSFFRWSSAQRYYERDYQAGKVFLLLTEEEESALEGSMVLRQGSEACRTAGYVVYEYAKDADFRESEEVGE